MTKMPPCGTYAAYQWHKKLKEPVDPACRKANAEYKREWRQRNPDLARMEAESSRAYNRALWRLSREYPERFRELALEEMTKDVAS